MKTTIIARSVKGKKIIYDQEKYDYYMNQITSGALKKGFVGKEDGKTIVKLVPKEKLN